MIIPKKSLGQNFLLDNNLCKKIISNINVRDNLILEIGPGTGQLTKEIIYRNPSKLILIEKDYKLYKLLLNKYKNNRRIIIINDDALLYDYSKYKNLIIISNLPYNISTKLIIKLLKEYTNINKMYFLIQKEVALKLNYKINHKINKYNFIMNVLAIYTILFNISNNVFYPKPKIQSSLIKIKPKNLKINIKKLFLFNQEIFKNKRKKIHNVIKLTLTNDKVNLLTNKRAEDLNIGELLFLFKHF